MTLTLTYRAGPRLPERVTEWLLNVRRSSPTDLRLPGLALDATAEIVVNVLGYSPSVESVQALHTRTGGNPLFVEQLLAAGSMAAGSGVLPQRLSDLLTERVRQVSIDARAVLAVLSVVGRPVSEGLIIAMCDLDLATVRDALRELRAADMLAPVSTLADHGPRHALLAEASLLGLLAGERRDLHLRAGRVLEETGELTAMPEVAWHYQLAGRPIDELRATIAAATASSAVFAYGEAAQLGERAIALYEQLPDAADLLKIEPLAIYRQAIEAVEASGRGEDAAALAERAFAQLESSTDG